MVKDDLDEAGKETGKTHRDISLSSCLQVMKRRSLRLYSDIIKAVYDQGPYMLSPSYAKFKIEYDVWMDMSIEERHVHLKRYFSFVPKKPESVHLINESHNLDHGVESLHIDQVPISVASARPATSSESSMTRKERNIIPESASDLQIPDSVISTETLQTVFRDAQTLLDDHNSILNAPSKDPLVKAVLNEGSNEPLIVKPKKTNRNLFTCSCRAFASLSLICHHSLAVAQVNGRLLEYVTEVKKSLSKMRKNPFLNLTAGLEKELPASLRGMKKNEVRKTSQRVKQNEQRRKENSFEVCDSAVTSVLQQTSGDNLQQRDTLAKGKEHHQSQIQASFSDQPVQPHKRYVSQEVGQQQQHAVNASSSHQGTYVPVQQPFTWSLNSPMQSLNRPQPNQRATLSTADQMSIPRPPSRQQIGGFQPGQGMNQFYMPLSYGTPHAALQNVATVLGGQALRPSMPPALTWHSGMSPYPYEIAVLPAGVSKCYGCGKEFAEKYRTEPHNIIIRHRDRRIRGRDASGRIIYNNEFTCAYYHLNRMHIGMKNPAFNGEVVIDEELPRSLGPARLPALTATSGLQIK